MTTLNRNQQHATSGFTLVELLVALGIAGLLMTLISTTVISTLGRQQVVEHMVSSASDGTRILTLVERDLRALWHHNIKGNMVLIGRDRASTGEGMPADWIDFVCTTDSVAGTLDTSSVVNYPSLCEVGYWLRADPDNSDRNQLWRREDPLLDDDLLTGGQFQLVSSRVKSLNLTYYESVGERAEPWDEWDSRRQGLPRRIKIELIIDRRVGNENDLSTAELEDTEDVEKTYIRHIVFDRRYPEIMLPNIAMVSIAPPPPTAEESGIPQGGGGPGGGGGGPGGGGAGLPGLGEAGGRLDRPTGGGNTATTSRGGRPGPGGSIPGGPPPNQGGPPLDLGDLLRGIGGGGGGGGNPFGGR